jgi:hypothetical protein
VISTPKAKLMTADIKDYFLCTPMEWYEYIKIHYRMIPEKIRQQYKLADIVDIDGYVYCEVQKGMYASADYDWVDYISSTRASA